METIRTQAKVVGARVKDVDDDNGVTTITVEFDIVDDEFVREKFNESVDLVIGDI